MLRDNAGLPVVNESLAILPGGALVKTLNERLGARTLPQARCRKTPTPAQRRAVVPVRITRAPGHHPWPLLPGVPPADRRRRDVRVPTFTEALDLEAESVARLDHRAHSATPRQIQTTPTLVSCD